MLHETEDFNRAYNPLKRIEQSAKTNLSVPSLVDLHNKRKKYAIKY